MSASYILPDLPYDFSALEPYISAEIMKLHHSKHHAKYVAELNVALEKYAEAERNNDLFTMIKLQQAIKFNGGGHLNHSIFWTNLAPAKDKGGKGGEMPEGELLKAIIGQFSSLDLLIKQLSSITIAIQGSGWGWLGYNPAEEKLVITTCDNQDPLCLKKYIPLLGIDVWEHAYYLDYKNVRAEYVKNIFNVVNWKNVEERFLSIKK
ncbi:MAG: superoxide dismutase [Chlamydiales bacterium]|jgi:Fe-Mn family superoxide dismutase|nr:superoxide dismutase [Chlamydiales bacterium]